MYITIVIVVLFKGYLGMRVEPVEKVSLDLVFVPKIMDPYAQFVREVFGWYGLGYAHTIQYFDIYSPLGLYWCILPL